MFSQEIETKLAALLKPEEISVLWKVHQRLELREYFFRTKTDLKWLLPAKELGYFEPREAPSPVEDERHYFSIPQWVVLPYLENVAKALDALGPAERGQIVQELLRIIRNISNARKDALAHDGTSLVLDNHRTWYHFTKILLAFRNVEIPSEVLEELPIWLTSRFETSLAGSEIAAKLLPKLLGKTGDAADIRKAEAVARALTRLTWVPLAEKQRRLGETEKPKLPLDEYWLLESFLTRKNGEMLGAACSSEFILEIAEKLHEVIRRERPHTLHIDIGREDAELLLRVTQPERRNLHCELGPMKKADHWLSLDWSSFKPQAIFDVESRDDKGWVAAILAQVESQTSKEHAAAWAERVSSFVKGLSSDLSYIWHRSISSDDSRSIDSSAEILTVILRELLAGHVRAQQAASELVLTKLTSPQFEFPIFTRIVIFVAGKFWHELSHHFWRLLQEKKLLEDPHVEAETFQLLSDNASNFTVEEKTRLKGIIAAGPQRIQEEDRELRITFWKQKWYGSLKADPEFQRLYDACRETTKADVRPHFAETQVRVGPGKTPLTADEILKTSDKDLLDFIPAFEAKERRSWDDPNPEALAMSLHGAASLDPNRFAEGFGAFGLLGYRYSYEILWGILDRVKKDPAAIEWTPFLAALTTLFSRADFWADALPSKSKDSYGANHQWVVGMIGQILGAAAQSKDELSKDFDDEAEKLLGIAINRLAAINDDEGVRDPVSRSLNSATGKTIEALLELSLRIARSNKISGRPLWLGTLQGLMEKALGRPFIEAHEILGRYLGHFFWLDRAWTEKQIAGYGARDDIFSYAFLVGYLHCDLYDDLFLLMVPQYRKALITQFHDDRSVEGLIDHLSMAYLRGYPNQGLNEADSLVVALIRKGDPARIEKLIGNLWMKRSDSPRSVPKAVVVEVKDGKTEPRIIESSSTPDAEEVPIGNLDKKVVDLWKFILPLYAGKESKTDEDKDILADLVKLTAFIHSLTDENVALIRTSAEYVDLGSSSSFLLEYLGRLMNVGDLPKNASFIADIFLSMLRQSTPDFRSEDIESLVEFIFVKGDAVTKHKALEICDIYAQRGRAEILRTVYEKYRSSAEIH